MHDYYFPKHRQIDRYSTNEFKVDVCWYLNYALQPKKEKQRENLTAPCRSFEWW